MSPPPKEFLAFLLLVAGLTGSCSPVPSLPPASPAQSTAPISTGTSPPATPPQAVFFSQLDMMDGMSGWASGLDPAEKRLLLHTSDGGPTWMPVTPPGDVSQVYPPYSAYFLDAQTAWAIRADDSLVRTLDGGRTWQILNQDIKRALIVPVHDWFLLRFADAAHGWLEAGYSAAGAYEFYYETRDGGVTWRPMNFESWPAELNAHRDYPNELAFWTTIDAIFYDSTRFMIAPGEQQGTLRVFLSTDRGRSWKDVPLPSSSSAAPPSGSLSDRKISPPFFFDAQNGALAVTLLQTPQNTTQIFMYRTADGGSTWSLAGGPSSIKDVHSAISFLDPRHAVLVCGSKLCLTSDSGNTWRALDFGVSVAIDNVDTYSQLDFVDPMTGWLLLKTNNQQGARLRSRLLKTSDGGFTWTELLPAVQP